VRPSRPAAARATASTSTALSTKILGKQVIGGTEYNGAEPTIAPGGTTGWRHHDGTVVHVLPAGTPGADKVHRGVDLGSTPVLIDVFSIAPNGAPMSESVADPGCPALG